MTLILLSRTLAGHPQQVVQEPKVYSHEENEYFSRQQNCFYCISSLFPQWKQQEGESKCSLQHLVQQHCRTSIAELWSILKWQLYNTYYWNPTGIPLLCLHFTSTGKDMVMFSTELMTAVPKYQIQVFTSKPRSNPLWSTNSQNWRICPLNSEIR